MGGLGSGWAKGLLGLLAAAAFVATAAAPAAATITPIVDCRTPHPTEGVFFVYFGYVNDGSQENIEFGPENQVIPGFGFQGQPTIFNTGSYPRVFRAIFNANVFSAIAWELAGAQAIATTADTPLCAAGATGPASGVDLTAATLHGVVNSEGVETAYHFEYGPTIAYGQSTPERQVTSTEGELVSEPVSGLAAGTTYHYRLVADGLEATVGEDRTFTTRQAAPPPPPPREVADLVVTRAGPARARVGRRVTIAFAVANAGPDAATGVRLHARFPRGLRVVSMHSPAGSCAAGPVRECPLGAIPRGSTSTVTMRVAPRRRGAFEYRASVTADQPELTVLDNTAAGKLRGRR